MIQEFQYHPNLLTQFPTIYGGVIIAENVKNGITPPDLQAKFQAEQQAVLGRIGEAGLADIPSIAAWRRAFTAFGVKPTQYRNAAEALLRRLTKQGEIPSINMMVDIGNLVSIRYGLPVAFFDTRAVTGAVTVGLANGTEHFSDLGESATNHPEAGEVIFVDEAGLVLARRWCWRQSVESAAREDTTAILVTVEGHHASAVSDVESALTDLRQLVAQYCGEPAHFGVLSAQRPNLIAT